MKRDFLFSQVNYLYRRTNRKMSNGRSGLVGLCPRWGAARSEKNSPPPAAIHPFRGCPGAWSLAEPPRSRSPTIEFISWDSPCGPLPQSPRRRRRCPPFPGAVFRQNTLPKKGPLERGAVSFFPKSRYIIGRVRRMRGDSDRGVSWPGEKKPLAQKGKVAK
jgi:hypothetical protein